MTAKTFDAALAIERRLGDGHLAAGRAKWFRAGLEAAAKDAEAFAASCSKYMRAGRITAEHLAARIRSIPVPEDV